MAIRLRHRIDIALLILRLFLSIRLLYGVLDNIFSWTQMKEFEAFLALHHFPIPLVSAIISVYAQAAAGLLFIIGWQVPWAAALMFINFVVALVMVHWGQSFEQITTVLFMIISSLVLLLTGSGRYGLFRSGDTHRQTSN